MVIIHSTDSYIKHRALLIDVFKYAKARGLYEGEQFDKTVYLKIRMSDELKQVVKECLSSPIPSP